MNSKYYQKYCLLTLAVTMLFSFQALAQGSISGTVKDATNSGIPGVSVVVKGSSNGVITGIDGDYTIKNVASSATIVYSFVGYSTQEIVAGSQNVINVVLSEDVSTLDEIVVTGYTSQRKKDIVGAVAVINTDEMNQTTASSFLQKMEGRAAGVTVTTSGRPGGKSTVRIRGISSFGNNDPLYVVDGVPVGDNRFYNFNPNDIESMQVLKDPSSASIYGARANNGVIIITTKKGKAGKTKIDLAVNTGIAMPVSGQDTRLIQNSLDYHQIIKRSHDNAGLATPTNIYGSPNSPSVPAYLWPNDGINQTQSVDESTYSYPNNLIHTASNGTNWWDALIDPALTTDYNLNLSGGTENALFNVSANYFDQNGTIKDTWLKRYSFRANSSFKAGRFTFGENLSFIRSDNVDAGFDDPGEGTLMGNLIKMQPIIDVFDVAGGIGGAKAVSLGNGSNPVGIAIRDRDNVRNENRLLGNFYASVKVIDGLSLKSSIGVQYDAFSDKRFNFPRPENSEPSFVTSLGQNMGSNFTWTWTNTANYVTTIGDNHNLNILAGTEAIKSQGQFLNGSLANYVTTDINAWYIDAALGDPATRGVSSSGYVNSISSLFAKVDYNFASKYYLSATVRRDGSSRFGPANKYGVFPALSAAWRVSDEAFMDNLNWVTDLKIRGGWGVTGNQNIGDGRTVDQFGGGTGNSFYNINGDNGTLAAGYVKTAIGNPDLKWEENISTNIGLDASFMNGKLEFVLDVYKRVTDGLLFAPPVPAAAGNANAPIVNIGEMQNQGVDFSLNYRDNINNDWSYDIGLNLSQYTNEITRIDGTSKEFFGGTTGGRGGTTAINRLNNPIGTFYGLVQDGIFQSQSEVDAHADQPGAAVGRFRFKDVNGDGQINADDRDIIGSYHPDLTGGLNLGLKYKNFDFNAFLFGSLGNDIFDITKEFTVFRLFNTNVRQDRLTESWTPTNTDGIYPLLDQNDQFSSAFSSFYVEDASYMRLKNLQLGYTVSPAVLSKVGLSQARIYIQGQNLLTMTKYSNIDPALPNIGNSDSSGGVDRGTYPTNKIYQVGVNLSF
ncbi:MAG: TonB-linked SusC/RagA family outer membrane protein [Arcticibacterium sp.]|jgi:TonB-linked SusC/RagA family outer membrane protein